MTDRSQTEREEKVFKEEKPYASNAGTLQRKGVASLCTAESRAASKGKSMSQFSHYNEAYEAARKYEISRRRTNKPKSLDGDAVIGAAVERARRELELNLRSGPVKTLVENGKPTCPEGEALLGELQKGSI